MQSSAPLVSIGMPVYNSAQYLADSLRAIIDQTFVDFELLISDNASDDGSSEICQQFAREDSRIRYSRHPSNIGCARNYNAVLERARGKFFKWSSSNDICQPRFLELCVAALEAAPEAVLAYPQTLLFDSGRGVHSEYDDNMSLLQEDPVERFRLCDQRLRYNNIMNGVIRTQHLRSTTLILDYSSSDMALMPELSLYGKFIEIPERLFHRCMDLKAHYRAGSEELHRAYFPDEPFRSRLRGWRRLRQMLAGVNRAPLTQRDRLRLYEYLARRAWWMRHDLVWP